MVDEVRVTSVFGNLVDEPADKYSKEQLKQYSILRYLGKKC